MSEWVILMGDSGSFHVRRAAPADFGFGGEGRDGCYESKAEALRQLIKGFDARITEARDGRRRAVRMLRRAAPPTLPLHGDER